MITLNNYFDKIFWIGSKHRPDRATQMLELFAKYKITAEKFEAIWKPLDHNNQPSGNMGCTMSHRSILELIIAGDWNRVLILEDDAKFVDDHFPIYFADTIRYIPDDWAMLYLGGHYGEMPKARVNAHCIRIGRMLSTHAYAVTKEFARKVAPHISGVGPIDSLYGQWNLSETCYCLDPRLVIQAKGYSDLQEANVDYEWVYQTRRHTWGELP
jgi:GR25 family glycosyltransferase involved in LPS biosynthesis